MGQAQRVVELHHAQPHRVLTVDSPPIHLPPRSLGAAVIGRAFPVSSWCGVQVRDLLAAEPGFGLNLLRHGTAYVHVLALAHLDQARLPLDLGERARLLMTSSYRHIVEDVACLPRALIPVLGKLGGQVHRRSIYRAMVEVAADPSRWKVLRHYARIAPVHLRLISMLPEGYPRAALVRKARNEQECEAIVSAVEKVEAILGVAERRRLVASFCALKTIKDLQPWLREILADVPFPEPPWPGTEDLRPLRNGRELKAAALQFRNCAASFTDEARGGTMHFYLSGRGRAQVMVAIEQNAYFGWIIHDLKGRENREISKPRMKEIVEAFEAAGVLVTRMTANSWRDWE